MLFRSQSPSASGASSDMQEGDLNVLNRQDRISGMLAKEDANRREHLIATGKHALPLL